MFVCKHKSSTTTTKKCEMLKNEKKMVNKYNHRVDDQEKIFSGHIYIFVSKEKKKKFFLI